MKPRMPILNRLQNRLKRLRAEHGAASSTQAASSPSESFAFAAEIPGGSAGKPLWRLAIEMQTQPQGEGEQLHMRVHWQANLGSSLSLEAPRAPTHASKSGSALAERVGGWLRTGLSRPLVRRLAEPLLRHDFNTWMELRASSADLADGTQALLPERERLQALGVELPQGDGPLAQTWAGATPGPQPGFAQLSLLRLDKRHLPPALAALLGTRPFQLAAAIVNVIEPQTKRP
ncbi:MAG: hypothetical protein JWR16_2193 [Nevskia sp.]|nr:hypothetical protein [Nevskia sp.]